MTQTALTHLQLAASLEGRVLRVPESHGSPAEGWPCLG